MNGLEFTASLVRALAWPVTVVVVAVLFRSSIREVLGGPLRRWKAGPLELEYWDLTTSRVQAAIPPAPPPMAGETSDSGLVEELASVAKVAPHEAVLEAFKRVEHRMRTIDGRNASKMADRLPASELALSLNFHDRISDSVLRALEGLIEMRNLAAHGQPKGLSPERAMEFLHLADAVMFALDLTARDQ